MSDAEEDRLRSVVHKWIRQTPPDDKITRLLLREHLNEITVGSQTGMRKGNQYSLLWEDINFELRLITLPDTKSSKPHTVPMTDDVYKALRDQTRLLYGRKEAAHMLGISVRSIDYYVVNGALPARRIGSRVLIQYNELVKFASKDHREPVAFSGHKLRRAT